MTLLYRNQFASTLLVTVLVIAAVGPSIAVAQDNSASVDDHTVVRGETVDIVVEHSGPATLVIGDENEGFQVNVTLGGGGTDTATLDTYATTTRNTNAFLNPGGTLEFPQSGSLNKALPPGEYTLAVYVEGKLEGGGKLYVKPRKQITGGYEGRFAGTVEAEAVTFGDAITRTRNVTRGDYAVFRVNKAGLDGAVQDGLASGALAAEGVQFRVSKVHPFPNREPEVYTNTAQEITVASPGEAASEFYVIWDTQNAVMRGNWNHTYQFEMILNGEQNPLVGNTKTVFTEQIHLAFPEIQMTATPGFTLQPWMDQSVTIHGETNLAPGTDLVARAAQKYPRMNGWSSATTVSDNETFTTTLDFSDAYRPGQFPLWIEEYRSRSTYRIRLPSVHADQLFPSQTSINNTVSVVQVTLSEGGFLRLSTNNMTVGTSAYYANGSYDSISIPLDTTITSPTNITATAIVDVNNNRQLDDADEPYIVNNTMIQETATIYPANGPQTPRPMTQQAPTGTANTTLDVKTAEPIQPVPENASTGLVPQPLFIPIVAILLTVLFKIS